jgi:hypothetical protein
MGSGAWRIPVAGIDAEGTVTVTLSRNGYEFKPASIENVEVHYAKPVTLAVTPADGDELLAQRTTKLTLAFDKPVNSLDLNDITVTDPDGTGAAKGELKPVSGTNNYNYTLAVSGVTKSGTIGVTVAKEGYDVTGGTVAVYDNQYNYLATGGTVTVAKAADGVYYETHTFTTVGTATLAFKNAPSLAAEVLVVAGGGGGGKAGKSINRGGGGGGGGVIHHESYTLTEQSYGVTVGDGGGPATSADVGSTGVTGGDSKFGANLFVAKGGGGGASHADSTVGGSGGSGGGSAGRKAAGKAVSQTAPINAKVYGNNGGNTETRTDLVSMANGGGGAGGAGANATASQSGAKGGTGVSISISGTAKYYGGGGAAGRDISQSSNEGAYGGNAGEANSGGGGCGGGGGTNSLEGTKGGSGIVIVRFPVPSVQ